MDNIMYNGNTDVSYIILSYNREKIGYRESGIY